MLTKRMMNKSLFSSVKDDYETPNELFGRYNQKYDFTLDVCADKKTTNASAISQKNRML